MCVCVGGGQIVCAGFRKVHNSFLTPTFLMELGECRGRICSQSSQSADWAEATGS